ncbi:MAG: CBS domain-containing protein [Nocardiopsaceae bacterium]|nr:CBS domain-containing protein [Nocardiopsaceae bacterium]
MADKVRDVMTAPPYTVSPRATLREAATIMRDKDIGDVIVTEGDTIVGVITDRDIAVRCVADGADCNTETVEGACSGRLAIIGPDADIDDAVQMMRENTVRRLPVVENDRLVGVLSIGDLALERDPRSALADISAAAPNP